MILLNPLQGSAHLTPQAKASGINHNDLWIVILKKPK